MAGSGAGLNYVNKSAGQVCSPISGGGTIDSGPVVTEARHFSKWVIQLIDPTGANDGSITGWSVQIYGTIDPRAKTALSNPNFLPYPLAGALPTTSWIAIEAPSSGSGTPAWYNPIIAFGQALFSPTPWVAVRYVATCTAGATGSFIVQCEAIP